MTSSKGAPAARSFQGVLRSAIESKKLGKVSYHAEALYFRLLLASDGFGRFHAHALDVAVRCDPRRVRAGRGSIEETAAALDELAAAGLVERYTADECEYLQLTDYWQPTKTDRAPQAEHPGPDEAAASIEPGGVQVADSATCPASGSAVEPGRIQPGSTVDPGRIQGGSACDPLDTRYEIETERERERESESAQAREAEPTPTPSQIQESPRQESEAPPPGLVHLSRDAMRARLAHVAQGFPDLAQRHPEVCEAFRDWVLVRWEQQSSKPALTETQIRKALGLAHEFAATSARVTLDDAAAGGWNSLRRAQFEERLQAASGGAGSRKIAPWQNDPADAERLKARGPLPLRAVVS